MDIAGLIIKVNNYQEVRNNTKEYREAWNSEIKPMLHKHLQNIIKKTGMKATVEEKTEMDNLEAIVLDMGQEESGISQRVTDKLNKSLIRYNGMLVYQQLFNGKIVIMIVPPFVEGLGQPKPPYNLEILRPDELKAPFLYRHIERLLKELTDWEDFDDDVPEKKSIGFQTGFKNNEVIREGISNEKK